MDNLNSTLRSRTFDRLKKSIAGQPADHHAVFHYYSFPFYHYITGVTLDRYFHDPKVSFETQLQVIEQLERCANLQPDVGPVAECSALGGQVCFDKEGFISIRPAGIETLEDIADLRPGDPWGDNYMRTALESLQYMLENVPNGIRVNPPICMGPFTIAAQLRGIGDFCADTLEDPEFVEALLEITTETCINYIAACEKLFGAPLHHILLCDDISAFLSVAGYREWVLPTYRRVMAAFPQTQFWLHNDAKAQHLAEAIAEAGFAAWQYAPSIPTDTLREKTGGKLALLGGLSPISMQSLTPQEAYDVSMETLKSFAGDTRCVLGVGGSVNQIPIPNLLAMLRAADDFSIG